MSYTPPDCTNIPFVFTESGYTPLDCSNVIFNYNEQIKLSTLSAALTAIRPTDYLNHAYTYIKNCPTYAIGYNSGDIQLIRARCLYGGIRDINAYIYGVDVNFINPNLQGTIHGFAIADMVAKVNAYAPSNIASSIKAVYKSYSSLSTKIDALTFLNFGMTLAGTHYPSDISAFLRSGFPGTSNVSSTVMSWAYTDFNAKIKIIKSTDLQTIINTIEPANLNASMRVILFKHLGASAMGFDSGNLGGSIRTIYSDTIRAKIKAVNDTRSNIGSLLKGVGYGSGNLHSYLLPIFKSDLSAALKAIYINNIGSYIYAVPHVSLKGIIHAWEEAFLTCSVNAINYPYNLTASINSSGEYRHLMSEIYPKYGVGNNINFPASIHSLDNRGLSATVSVYDAPYLYAYINVLGAGADISASIYPKMVRLTTAISISTLASRELSAMINSKCFNTGYSVLSSYIGTTYKADLPVYIKANILSYNSTDMSASIGYTNASIAVDKIKLSVNILPSSYYAVDKYKIMLSILNGGSYIGASINGTLRFNNINAYIKGTELSSYVFDTSVKNRETVIYRSYDGVMVDYSTVEMSFKSIVSDYFYNDSGYEIWKSDRDEKWALNVSSILPENTTLKLKRRLHRAMTLYDLKSFGSIDAAMRYAIDYVTDSPVSNISSCIESKGMSVNLLCSIAPTYIKSNNSSIGAYVNPTGSTIIVDNGTAILKL